MIERDITISNKLGLHARAAAKLVSTASQYGASIHLQKNGQEVNAKSIMGVMMLAASQGTTIVLKVDGDDEASAMDALTNLINDKFGEDE